MGGFMNLKDVLDVVVIPLAVLALGWLLPLMLEWRRRTSFEALIKREIAEIAPSPSEPQPGLAWHQHLRKRFLHEKILENASENRDFILSLDADLIYNLHQMWTHFEKGRLSVDPAESLEHAYRFRDYLRGTCQAIEGERSRRLVNDVYRPWDKLIRAYEAPSARPVPMMKIETIHHVSLPVTDLPRSKRFYTEILGLVEIERPPFDFPGAWFQAGDRHLHLIVGKQSTFRTDKGIDSHDIHFALRVRSYREALQHFRAKGYDPDSPDPLRKVRENPTGRAGFPQIYVVDPDRNVIEINAAQID